MDLKTTLKKYFKKNLERCSKKCINNIKMKILGYYQKAQNKIACMYYLGLSLSFKNS